ncbi:MAG: HPr family phosphocarrier protein [Caldicoprobacterales bacterium]|jgi:phosphocarrier protein HPr|nr:HPr family phosphocarrier protein [Clostridiales bacterium]
MVEKEFIIENEAGLHARPAAMLIKEASRFQSDILVIRGNKTGNAKSLLSILALGVFKGTRVTVRIDGSDEIAAMYKISKLIESNFSEES